MKLDDKQLIDETNHRLNQEVESLDGQTLHRLRSARMHALSQNQSWFGKNGTLFKWLTGAGAGLAIAGVLTFMVAPNLLQSKQLSPFDDLEILTSEVDMDVVDQLDFYVWLDESFHEGS